MNRYDADQIVEGFKSADAATTTAAWQELVDCGVAWELTTPIMCKAEQMIADGTIHAGWPNL